MDVWEHVIGLLHDQGRVRVRDLRDHCRVMGYSPEDVRACVLAGKHEGKLATDGAERTVWLVPAGTGGAEKEREEWTTTYEGRAASVPLPKPKFPKKSGGYMSESSTDPHTHGDGAGRVAPRPPIYVCLLYTSPSPRDRQKSRMPSSD